MRYLLLTLLAGSLFATDPTPTDNYLALTATLLEHRIINDDHLLRMIDSAEQGKAVNPISPSETKIDSQKLIASQAYNNVLKDDIDTSRITPWAKERLSQEAKEREEKKDKQRESKSLAKPSKNQLIGQTHLNTCHLDLTGQLQCSEKKIPNLKGKTLALMDGSLLLITQEQNLVKIDLINGDVQTFSEKHRGNLQDLAWHKYSNYAGNGNFQSVNYLCVLLTNGQVECRKNDQDFFQVPPKQDITSLQISKDTLYTLSSNGELSCFNLAEQKICNPPTVPGKIKQMGPVKDFSKKLCIVLEDGDYHCFSSENQSELETHKPQNLPPIEAIYPDSMDTFCALFKTGLFSCWGNNGAYIEDASEIPGIVSANLDTGQVCTLNENHEMKCFRLYDVIM